ISFGGSDRHTDEFVQTFKRNRKNLLNFFGLSDNSEIRILLHASGICSLVSRCAPQADPDQPPEPRRHSDAHGCRARPTGRSPNSSPPPGPHGPPPPPLLSNGARPEGCVQYPMGAESYPRRG